MPKKDITLIVILFFSALICFFNQTTVNPALPTIIADFEIDASIAQWLISAYLLAMAIMIPINAFLIERFSVKTICVISMGIYTCGCFLTGSGILFYITLIGRVLQGCAHGVIIPTVMAVMLYIFPVEKRGFVFGLTGLFIGLAPILGPTYSGIIVDKISWNFLYYSIGLFSFLCFLSCLFILPKKRLTKKKDSRIDPLSLVLSILGFGVLLFGCSEIGVSGFNFISIGCLIIGIITVFIFFVLQSKIKFPMLEVKVFKFHKFSISIIILVICQLAYMGAIVLFPFLIQDVLGYSATISGLVMIPSSLIMGIMSPITGKLFDKFGIRVLAIIGMLILTIAGLGLSTLNEFSPLYLLIIFLCVRNLGASFVMMNVNTWGINSLPTSLLPHGNSIASTFRQIGMSFSATISITIYTIVANSLPGGINNASAGIAGINASFLYQSVLCLIALVVCVLFVKDKKSK